MRVFQYIDDFLVEPTVGQVSEAAECERAPEDPDELLGT